MTNYWIATHAKGQGLEAAYELVDVLPAGKKIGRYGDEAFYAVEPYLAHAKPYGLDGNKPVEIDVYGASGEYLLFKYHDPSKVKLYAGYDRHLTGWNTCRFDQTTEGWRFVRSVVKVLKVLISVAKKVAVERNKRERNRAAAKAREGREGTCQICEGRQIVQPTGENRGTLVLHGYTRPGYGFTVGNCYGYHRKPFEVACDALKEWIAILTAEKERTEASLAALPTLTSMLIEKNWRDKTLIEITPEHDRWNHAMAERKWNLESSLRSLTRELAHHTERLATWAPVPGFAA